jgi:hypothetical protein
LGLAGAAAAVLLAVLLDPFVDVFPDALAAADVEAAVEADVGGDAAAAGAGSSFLGSPSPGFPGPMNVLTLSQNPTAIPLQETIFIYLRTSYFNQFVA